jgi:hypothetical protein
MRLRFFLDPENELPHIYSHGVDETEVQDVLRKPLEEIQGRGRSIIAIGQTRAGRYLRVIYSPDGDAEGIFVITAYDLATQTVASPSSPTTTAQTTMTKQKDPNRYPKGLNQRKVRALIDHYEAQTDAEAIAEAEAAYRKRTTALVEVPVKLLPAIRELIAKRAG